MKRLKTLAMQGEYVQAAKLADAIFTELADDQLAYVAASVFAVAARIAQEDKASTDEQRLDRFNTNCERAFELLEIFQRAGHAADPLVVNDLLKSPDWTAIRDDPRFGDLTMLIQQSLDSKAHGDDEVPPQDSRGDQQ